MAGRCDEWTHKLNLVTNRSVSWMVPQKSVAPVAGVKRDPCIAVIGKFPYVLRLFYRPIPRANGQVRSDALIGAALGAAVLAETVDVLVGIQAGKLDGPDGRFGH